MAFMLETDLLFYNNFPESSRLSKNELHLLEADIFIRLSDSLCDLFLSEYKNYIQLMKLRISQEKKIMDGKLARCIINDILSTGEYTLPGIAYYTETPEEVVYEIIIGRNDNPSSKLLRKIIKLHQSVRFEIYKKIFEKISAEQQEIK